MSFVTKRVFVWQFAFEVAREKVAEAWTSPSSATVGYPLAPLAGGGPPGLPPHPRHPRHPVVAFSAPVR